MSDKPKFPRAAALAVARELCTALAPFAERLVVAGSLRRRKEFVGDVELLYVPRVQSVPDGFFDTRAENLADGLFARWLADGVLEQRRNENGSTMWGPKNKFARHVRSGIPVDLFEANAENWFNYKVCRTGGAENNVRIAAAAQARGWKWNPYGVGFSREATMMAPAEERRMESEREVFEFVGLPYVEPWQR